MRAIGALAVSGIIAVGILAWVGQSRTAAMAECRIAYLDRPEIDARSLIPDCMRAKYFSFDIHCLQEQGKDDPEGGFAKILAYDVARCYRPVTPANWVAGLLYDRAE